MIMIWTIILTQTKQRSQQPYPFQPYPFILNGWGPQGKINGIPQFRSKKMKNARLSAGLWSLQAI